MKRLWLGGLLGLLLVASPAMAQNPVEFGIDATLRSMDTEPDRTTTIEFPAGRFRVGFFINETASIEPAVSLFRISGGDDAFTLWMVELGLLWHFMQAADGPNFYLRPFAGISGFSNGESDSNPHFGAGVGVKLPSFAERMRWRFEVNYTRQMVDDPGEDLNVFGFNLGLSFLTR